jgi:hypothetical protein
MAPSGLRVWEPAVACWVLSGKPNRAELIPALPPLAVVSLNRPLLAPIKRDTDMLAG